MIPFQPLCCSIPYGEADKLDESSTELGLLLAAPVEGGGRSLTAHPGPASPRPQAHVLPYLALEQPRL